MAHESIKHAYILHPSWKDLNTLYILCDDDRVELALMASQWGLRGIDLQYIPCLLDRETRGWI